jgi:hypothetical protein
MTAIVTLSAPTQNDDKGLLDFRSGIDRLSAVAAPITVVTALLMYVGWIRNRAYFGFFGIDQGILGLSLQDYVLRSVDVTFGAVARILTAALAFIVFDKLLVVSIKNKFDSVSRNSTRPASSGNSRADVQQNDVAAHGDDVGERKESGPIALPVRIDWVSLSLTTLGIALLVLGLLFALHVADGLDVLPLVGPGILGAGAILTLRFGSATTFRLSKTRSFGLLGYLMMLSIFVLALFWAGTLYAQDLGLQAARAADSSVATLPLATVFSNNFLDIPGSRVRATQVAGPAGTSRYRYTGLSFLAYSNNRWFLISGRYSEHYRSSVVVLRDSEHYSELPS